MKVTKICYRTDMKASKRFIQMTQRIGVHRQQTYTTSLSFFKWEFLLILTQFSYFGLNTFALEVVGQTLPPYQYFWKLIV